MQSRINYKEIEEKWQNLRYDKFKSVPDGRKSYTILQAPPNVTGQLHIGHFLNSTFNDIIARRKRQEGYNVCFAVGLDHAGLATQTKVEQYLRETNVDKNKLSTEEFLEECNKWKEKCGGGILNQFKKLGLSTDCDRLTFTLDANYSSHVINTFVKLYEAGLIYKGDYMTNWCTALQTAISDEECVQSEEEIGLYYIKYKLNDNSGEYLTVATTRPETLFGDVAVAYNPEDERYKQYKGKSVILPILNKSIPLVEDERIKIEFGTGLVKITPGHDKDDFVTGQKCNLPVLTILDKQGHITNTNTKYDGMFRDKARKEVLKELQELKLLESSTRKKSQISRCSRSGVVIEPMVTKQWFIRMKPLAEMASDLLESNKIQFYPDRIKNTFNSWVSNIRDWCISRQIIYSHRIPIYYCSNQHENCACSKPEYCSVCGETDLVQETDTLDTWASSYVYQFATFSDEEMAYYYPLDIMVTGQDILFFWIMRMMMTSAFLHKTQPFDKVLFHGIVRDDNNQKMSKSKGNVIDPLEIINKIGVDPMRLSIMMLAPKDGDLKISMQIFEVGKTFCTKLWNICRFLQTNNVFNEINNKECEDNLTHEDKDILDKLSKLSNEITDCYDRLDFQQLVRILYTFTWDDFANGYLEYAKLNMTSDKKILLLKIFTELVKHLYPIIPHITEELWEIMGNHDLYLEKI